MSTQRVPGIAIDFIGTILRLARDIMRLNATVGEITDNRADYNEYPYGFSVLGNRAAD